MSEPAIGIIAGGGLLPGEVAKAAAASGRRVVVFPIAGEKTLETPGYTVRPVAWGGFGGLFKLLDGEGVGEVVFAGSIHARPTIATAKLDWTTIRKLPELLRLLASGDDTILSGIARLFEEHGVRVRGIAEIAPSLVAAEGPVGRRKPVRRELEQIAEAFAVVRALGLHDVGQAAIVCGRRAVAVEGIEGTDRMIERVAEMRDIGRLPDTRDGVLVKLAKPQQDLRFDLPTIGRETVIRAREAGLRGIAIEAGRSIVLQPQAVGSMADKHGLFVVGWSDREG